MATRVPRGDSTCAWLVSGPGRRKVARRTRFAVRPLVCIHSSVRFGHASHARSATTCNQRWLSGRPHQRPRRISSALSHSGSCTRSMKRHLSPQLPHTTDLPSGSARPLRVCLNSLTSDSCSVCWQALMRRLSRPDGLVTVSVQRVSWLVVAVSMCANTIGPGAWLTGAKGQPLAVRADADCDARYRRRNRRSQRLEAL